MSPEMKRLVGADEPTHDRARMLAAETIDGPLEPGDSEWLEAHIGACPDCAAVAEEYRAIHLELGSLATPEVPRDLWARTSAALDQIDAKAARRSPGKAGAARPGNRPLVATAVAVGCVVVVAAASLLAQSPVLAPVTAPTRSDVVAFATPSPRQSPEAQGAPLAVVNGTSYWIATDGGVYQIKGGTTQCTAADGSCTVAGGGGNTLGSIVSDQVVSAAIAPDATRAAVWTADKVVILPLTSKPQTVAIDLLTPKPTLPAAPTARATAASTSSPATPSPVASVGAVSSAATSATQTPTPAPTATPVPPSPTPATPTPSAAPAATQPIAILGGRQPRRVCRPAGGPQHGPGCLPVAVGAVTGNQDYLPPLRPLRRLVRRPDPDQRNLGRLHGRRERGPLHFVCLGAEHRQDPRDRSSDVAPGGGSHWQVPGLLVRNG